MKFLLLTLSILSLAGCATAPKPEPMTYTRPSGRHTFVWPVTGSVISYYGAKFDRVKNKGIDIRAGAGAGVRASESGRVVFCGERLKGFGKTVILDHDGNYQTVYAYNSDLLVKAGDRVEQNHVIARVGKTGRAKEPSLHFEIRKLGEPHNPFHYLPDR